LKDQRCALCHEEHVGRNRKLIPTSNQTCVACHEQTSAFCTSPPDAQVPRNVSQFSLASHGDFASLESSRTQNADSPRIEFDHALHMNPGQVMPGRRGAMTLDRLPKSLVEKYQKAGQTSDAFVQLQCADCHEFQASSTGLQRSGEYGWGRNSLPISYNRHCVACHPLTLPGQRKDQWAIPHGVAVSSLRDSIAGQLASNELAMGTSGAFWETDGFPIRVPGAAADQRRGERTPNDNSGDNSIRVMSRISQQCRVCHINSDVESITSIPPIPSPRLRAGKFDHGAHRSVTCIACHPQADPTGKTVSDPERLALSSWLVQTASDSLATGEGVKTSVQAADQSTDLNTAKLKMILGIASCTPCHRDVRQSDEVTAANKQHAVLFGGLSDLATDRCTVCHQYHSYAHPQQKLSLDVTIAPVAEAAVAGKFPSTLSLINTQAIPPPGSGQPRDASGLSGLTASENRWLGSDSCGTSTCHSGPIGRQPNWNSSQNVFEAFDPHARAGMTLASELTKQIVWTLDPKSKDFPARFLEVLKLRCNSCHSPMDAHSPMDVQGVMLSDSVPGGSGRKVHDGPAAAPQQSFAGVSCEACHGPASGWVESHLEEDWKVSGSMRNTRDFVKRIEGCVRCHIGSRRADGLVRDMNHDMIAAGHPALRFDGWSALQRLPRHAPLDRTQDGLPQIDGESELRRFLVAQAIGMRAAFQLVAERREDTQSKPNDDTLTASVWPELSDFDCFACHHNLKIVDVATRPSSGHPLPHPWLLAGFNEHGSKYLAASDIDAMNKALDTVRLRAAGINQVKPAVSRIDEIIGRYLSRLADSRPLPNTELKSLASVQTDTDNRVRGEGIGNSSVAGDWYQASHWYLRSHVWIRDRRLANDRTELAGILREMADSLQFRRENQRDAYLRVDSPEYFDMKSFRELTKRLADTVESK